MKKIPDKVFNEVKEIYLKQIEVPRIKPEIQYILCPIGLVGAGKTTVVKPLAKKLGLVRISKDDIRKLLKERGCGYEAVEKLAGEVVEHFLQQGFSIVLDADCMREEVQEKMQELKEKYNLKVLWIHINPPEEFILQKLGNLEPNWLGTAERMVENYYQRKPLHENLNFPFVYTFDTSKDDLDNQIDEAVSIILRLTNSNTDPA